MFRLAHELGIAGWVRNSGIGVLVHAEGEVSVAVMVGLRRRPVEDLPVAEDLQGGAIRAVPGEAEVGAPQAGVGHRGPAGEPLAVEVATSGDLASEQVDVEPDQALGVVRDQVGVGVADAGDGHHVNAT